MMRFVPFVGPYIAAAFPILLAAAVDPGWSTVLYGGPVSGDRTHHGPGGRAVVFGRGTGISPLAVIVSTVFWTWLWGPSGFSSLCPSPSSSPCSGGMSEGLQFFEILLERRARAHAAGELLSAALSGDAAEATYEAERCLNEQNLESCLDRVALSALKLAERDARRGLLDNEQAAKIADTVKEMLADLADFEPRRWFFLARRSP